MFSPELLPEFIVFFCGSYTRWTFWMVKTSVHLGYINPVALRKAKTPGSKGFITCLDKQKFQRKIVNIFLPINFNIYVLGAQRTVSLRCHNICFGWEIWKLNFHYALLTEVQFHILYVSLVTPRCWGNKFQYCVLDMNTFKLNGIFQFYQLDQSISVLRVVGWYFSFLFKL